MIGLLSIVALGFFLGMRHATDPDHVIAVTTIVARHRTMKHAAVIGAVWGLGHALTILAVGGAMILLGWVIPPRIGLSMEFSVGLMLILLGILNLSGMLQWLAETFSPARGNHPEVHFQAHVRGDFVHIHPHAHNLEGHSHRLEATPLGWLDRHCGGLGIYQILRPLLVGVVHGLAGSAAVALLVLTTIRNPQWALVYLLVFGVGTIAGMMLVTGAISLPLAYAGKKYARMSWGIRVASGVISLGFGLFLAYQIGFVNGLFTGHPQWTPR